MNALRRSVESLGSVLPMRKQAPCTRPLTGCEAFAMAGRRCEMCEGRELSAGNGDVTSTDPGGPRWLAILCGDHRICGQLASSQVEPSSALIPGDIERSTRNFTISLYWSSWARLILSRLGRSTRYPERIASLRIASG